MLALVIIRIIIIICVIRSMASVFHHLLAALCIADLIFLLSLVVVSPVISSCHCLCHNIIKSRSTDIIFLAEHANLLKQAAPS